MRIITQHEFIENNLGELVLLLDALSADFAIDPVLLVSRFSNKAYLQRAPDDIYEISDINHSVIKQLRATGNVLVVELTGETIVQSYDALTGCLEKDEAQEEAPLRDAPQAG